MTVLRSPLCASTYSAKQKGCAAKRSFAPALRTPFAAAESYAALLAARALIGAGFAGALLSSFKSFTHWLPKRRLPLAFSIQSFVGGAGFMAATHPVTLALEYFTWRQIMFASGGAVALSIAMLLFCGVRQRVESANPPESFKGLPITLVSAAMVSLSFMGFGGIVENIFGV